MPCQTTKVTRTTSIVELSIIERLLMPTNVINCLRLVHQPQRNHGQTDHGVKQTGHGKVMCKITARVIQKTYGTHQKTTKWRWSWPTRPSHAGDIHRLGTPESTPSKILHDMDVNLEEHLKRHRKRTSGRIWWCMRSTWWNLECRARLQCGSAEIVGKSQEKCKKKRSGKWPFLTCFGSMVDHIVRKQETMFWYFPQCFLCFAFSHAIITMCPPLVFTLFVPFSCFSEHTHTTTAQQTTHITTTTPHHTQYTHFSMLIFQAQWKVNARICAPATDRYLASGLSTGVHTVRCVVCCVCVCFLESAWFSAVWRESYPCSSGKSEWFERVVLNLFANFKRARSSGYC